MNDLQVGVGIPALSVDHIAVSPPAFGTFAWRVIALHTLTYFLVGLAAFLLLDYRTAYETTDLRYLMRSTTSPWSSFFRYRLPSTVRALGDNEISSDTCAVAKPASMAASLYMNYEYEFNRMDIQYVVLMISYNTIYDDVKHFFYSVIDKIFHYL